jgi:tetratricopeptide (TPR) repeat protein
MSTSQFEASMRKLKWEASKRAQRSGLIKSGPIERALELHIAGRYEEAVGTIHSIPESERPSAAWRVLGHAELGRGKFQKAIEAHRKAMELNEGDRSAQADDHVNLAAVFIGMNHYDDAWQAAERAKDLAPGSIMPWTPRIAILNRQGRREELRNAISELLSEHPNVLSHSVFRDHIENDVDFIGIKQLIDEMKVASREEKSR